jgi:nucleotide-binding universal stress UspA family protein
MFHHLLIPLDGSPMAESALRPAAFLAERSGARVTLLHVLERGAPAEIHGARHLRTAEEADAYLRELADRAFPSGVTVKWHVHTREVTDVAHSLVDHAYEYVPDLMIMCSHGEGRLRDWVLGTLPQQVVSRGVIPVLVLRRCREGEGRTVLFERILAPLDGDEAHERGLAPALDLARLCGARVRLFTVVPTSGTLSGPLAISGMRLPGSTRALLDVAVQAAADSLDQAAERIRGAGVEVETEVRRGDPADVIAKAVREFGIDLVAMGTHGKAGTRAFWAGSLASRLLHKAPDTSFLLTPLSPSAPGSRPPVPPDKS